MECAYSAETPVSKPDDNTSNWLCMKEAALKGYVLQHPFVERGDLPSPSARLPSVTSLLSGVHFLEKFRPQHVAVQSCTSRAQSPEHLWLALPCTSQNLFLLLIKYDSC